MDDKIILREREEWVTRINLQPSAKDTIRAMARSKRLSTATFIGMTLEEYVTTRSTA